MGPAACSLRALIVATQRLRSDVLDHDPTHEDLCVVRGRLPTALVARGLALCGVTTDGAARSPAPLREGCGKGRHHIGQFHVLKDSVKAVEGVGARARQGLAAMHPTLPQGRPSTSAAKAAARPTKRLAAQGAALGTPRYLCVQRPLNPTARKTLGRVSRGLPQCHALRAVMDQV